MRFSFDAQQVEFRSQLRTLLDKECTAADVHSELEARRGAEPSRRRWEQLAAMGVVGLTVPEAEGGLGLRMVDLVGLLEEAGRACLPEPLAETTALVVPFLSDLVEDLAAEGHGPATETARDWMRRIADGTAIATVTPDVRSPAVWGREADVLIVFEPGRVVLLAAGDLAAGDLAAGDLAAGDLAVGGVAPVSSLDSTRRLGRVRMPAGSGSTLVEGPAVERHLSRLRNRGAVASAAVLLGAADTLMRVTRQYALERHQFGRPIGSFQAVKHHLATAYVKLEMSRPLIYRAALSLDEAPEAREAPDAPEAPDAAARDCSMAKATASDAALEVARVALQIHGAMGYTWEHDIHLWMKRIWFLATSWGDSSAHFAAVLESLSALAVTTVPTGNCGS